MGTGAHFIDRMLYWFGKPSSFVYRDDSYGGNEANCRAEFQFQNDLGAFTGEMFLSQAARLRNEFVVETDRYRVMLGDTQTDSITLLPCDAPDLSLEASPAPRIAKPGTDYFQIQLEDFVDSVRRKRKPWVDGWFASDSIQLIEQMYSQRQPLEESWIVYRNRDRISPAEEVVIG